MGGVSCLVGSNPTLSAVTETLGNPMLEIDRVLPARASVAFGAFADPDRLRMWWGPKGFTIPGLRFEPRVGETYRIEMRPPEGNGFHLQGEFREVVPPTRLSFTFAWDPPDPDDIVTLATLSFRDTGESTEVSLVQGPFKTEERRDLHADGWSDSFDKLEAMLGGSD